MLTPQQLITYKDQNMFSATETIPLHTIRNISSTSNTEFVINSENNYAFRANDQDIKVKWIKAINLCKTNHCIAVPIIVQCARDNKFNYNHQMIIPYDPEQAYSINTFILDIIKYTQKKYIPFQFIPCKIKDSFLGQEIIYNDYDWKDSDPLITDYADIMLKQMGITLEIDLAVYQHKINTMEAKCEKMKGEHDLCPIYAKMRYQDLFTEHDLNHLYDYVHDTVDCKYGDECYAFIRVAEGGNHLKDRCHVMIYKHPPRGRTMDKRLEDGINSFCLNDEWADNTPLYYPSDEEKKQCDDNSKDGYLALLVEEVILNGFKSDLCLHCSYKSGDECKHDKITIMEHVDNKMNCMRHKLMGSPLNRAEILSIMLYTAGESNYDLCKSQRNGDYHKWKWFDYCLYNAINKLSKREYGSYKIYTGLCGTKLKDKYIDCGYFKTYVSTSWMKQIAQTFADDTGMIFEIDDKFRENAICCDISWISKFGISECEILIARSIDAVFNRFQCKIIDEKNGTQIVSLRLDREESNKPIQMYQASGHSNVATNLPTLVSSESILEQDRIGDIDKIQREIVHLFLLPIRWSLNQIIPQEIFNLICVYFHHHDQIYEILEHKCYGIHHSVCGSTSKNIYISAEAKNAMAVFNIPICKFHL